MSPYYRNQLHAKLLPTLQAARRAGVVPVQIPSDAFDALTAEGVRMIFVLTDGRLVAAPRQRLSEYISHTVLAEGRPILAAGEFELEFERPAIVVSALNNASGHYQPAADCLEVAREAFEAAEIPVRPGAVTPYDF